MADPSVIESVEEFGDHIQLQILSVFPGFILQQIYNCLAVRHVVPRGVDKMDLVWTYFGFADDSPEMNQRRLKQQNLVGPAGFISMEDGCVGGFVQRGTAAAADEVSVIEMGGSTAESQATRATESRCAASGRPIAGIWATEHDGRRQAGRAERGLCAGDRQRAVRGMAEAVPRSLPLQAHHGRECGRRAGRCG
jgi:hypothetical protein